MTVEIPFQSNAKRPLLTPLDPPRTTSRLHSFFVWSRLQWVVFRWVIGEVGRGLCIYFPRLQLGLDVNGIGSHERSQPPAARMFGVTLDAFDLEAEARYADQIPKERHGGFVGEPLPFDALDAGDD